jgi:hypothetical protein
MKKNKKTKNNFKILLIGLFICLNTIQTTNAYTETLKNDFVDGNLDEFYQINYNTTETQIYFANSTQRIAFFILTNENITQILMNTTIINSNSSTNQIAVYLKGQIAEIVLSTAIISKYTYYSITINNKSEIILNPYNIIPVIAPTTTNTTTTTTTSTNTTTTTNNTSTVVDSIDEVNGWDYMNAIIPGFWIVISLVVAFFLALFMYSDLENRPRLKMRDENGKTITVGQYLFDVYDSNLKLWAWVVITTKGIKKIYSKYTFGEMSMFKFDTYWVFHQLYPNLIKTKIKVPDNIEQKITADTPKKTTKNKFLHIFFAFFSRTPIRKVSKWLWDHADKDNTELEEIDYIIPDLMLDTIEYLFNVKYEVKKQDKESGKMEWIKEEQENIVYNEILTIKNNETKNWKIELSEVREITVRTPQEAFSKHLSRAELVNIYEHRNLRLIKEIDRCQDRINNISNQNLIQTTTLKEKLHKNSEIYREVFTNFDQDHAKMLKSALSGKVMGAPETKIIIDALQEHKEERDTKLKDIEKENAELRAKNSILAQKTSKTSKRDDTNIVILEMEENKDAEK